MYILTSGMARALSVGGGVEGDIAMRVIGYVALEKTFRHVLSFPLKCIHRVKVTMINM